MYFLLYMLYEFEKVDLPSDPEELPAFLEKLLNFGVSLQQFKAAAEMDNVTMYDCNLF